jgi:hypothetical protein
LSPILGIIASSRLAVVAGDYESIATVTVGSGGSSSVEFTSIPATYSHLQVRFIGRSNYNTTGQDNLVMRLNSDSGSNYAEHYLSGNGSSADASSQSSINTLPFRECLVRDGNSASIFSTGIIDFLDYKSTNKNKTVRALFGNDRNGAGYVALGSGLYFATPAAITTITFTVESSRSFVQYSQFALYGIKS